MYLQIIIYLAYTPSFFAPVGDGLFKAFLQNLIGVNKCAELPKFSSYPQGPNGIDFAKRNNINENFYPRFGGERGNKEMPCSQNPMCSIIK